MNRINKKEIKAEILNNSKKQFINTTHVNCTTIFKRFNPLGDNGNIGFDTMFKGLNYGEALDLLHRAFEHASEREGVSIDEPNLRITKPKYDRNGVDICFFREETDEEFENRVETETNLKLEKLRRDTTEIKRKKQQLLNEQKRIEEQLKNM